MLNAHLMQSDKRARREEHNKTSALVSILGHMTAGVSGVKNGFSSSSPHCFSVNTYAA